MERATAEVGKHSMTDSLAMTLRTLRVRAGLTGERLGARCAMSQSKISKIETGRIIPSLTDVERILHALNVSADVRAKVANLAKPAAIEFQHVRDARRKGLERRHDELGSLEQDAAELRYFAPATVPALISTPDYIKAGGGGSYQSLVRTLERQRVLYDEAKRFVFLVTESAARWPVGSRTVMAAQFEWLASLSRLPNVRLGFIPVEATQLRGPINPFTVYDERLVTADTFGGVLVMRDPRDVALHLDLFTGYADAARFGDQARALLAAWTAG
jgi:transcriptional regulator with XRE-family HTH domain